MGLTGKSRSLVVLIASAAFFAAGIVVMQFDTRNIWAWAICWICCLFGLAYLFSSFIYRDKKPPRSDRGFEVIVKPPESPERR